MMLRSKTRVLAIEYRPSMVSEQELVDVDVKLYVSVWRRGWGDSDSYLESRLVRASKYKQ